MKDILKEKSLLAERYDARSGAALMAKIDLQVAINNNDKRIDAIKSAYYATEMDLLDFKIKNFEQLSELRLI